LRIGTSFFETIETYSEDVFLTNPETMQLLILIAKDEIAIRKYGIFILRQVYYTLYGYILYMYTKQWAINVAKS